MSQRKHFHSLDALRFFAFLKVFLLHLPIHGFAWFSFVKAGGGIGVEFFFVLSGFLISYISLKEKQTKSSFNFKGFFMRRVLRIWPLYYLMVLFAFATPFLLDWMSLPYSNEGYEPNYLYSVFFLENYKMMLEGTLPNVSPLSVMWSLCIEEHFYIIWALAFLFIPVKRFHLFALTGIAVSILSKYVFTKLGIGHGEILTHLDWFCFGGLMAYLYLFKLEAFEQLLGSRTRTVKRLIVGVVIVLVLLNPFHHIEGIGIYLHHMFFGLGFAILIGVFLSSENSFGVSDKNLLSRLGKVSYGLYLYHIIVINLLIQLFKQWDYDLNDWKMAILFSLGSFALSVFISMLSYRFFEKPFLKLKNRFR